MYEVARGFSGGQEFATSINVANEDSVTGVTELGVQPANRLSSLNCWRLSVPRYLSCSHALRAANDFKMGARARSARMPPCDRLPQAVTMPAAIGTERFVLIGVASLLHAKQPSPPLTK